MSDNAAPLPIHLHHDAFGRLVVTLANGQCHSGVVPVRAFPLAAPDARPRSEAFTPQRLA